METIVNRIINDFVKDSQVYKTKGYTWVILKDKKEWVVNISDCGYLRYNYRFFENIFKLISLELGDNNVYIKNWVEKNLKIKIGDHYHPDYLPGEYDWTNQFDINEIVS